MAGWSKPSWLGFVSLPHLSKCSRNSDLMGLVAGCPGVSLLAASARAMAMDTGPLTVGLQAVARWARLVAIS
eukprot:481814-Pelagomonas_calceolata.AAC.1